MNILNLLVSEEVWWGLPKKLEFLKIIVNTIESVLWPILIVVATLGSIYAIYLGINMAKAEDTGKRDEARKRLIYAVIAMGITVVMILLINVVIIPNIPGWVANNNISSAKKTEVEGTVYTSAEDVSNDLGVTQYAEGEWHVRVGGKKFTITWSKTENSGKPAFEEVEK